MLFNHNKVCFNETLEKIESGFVIIVNNLYFR